MVKKVVLHLVIKMLVKRINVVIKTRKTVKTTKTQKTTQNNPKQT